MPKKQQCSKRQTFITNFFKSVAKQPRRHETKQEFPASSQQQTKIVRFFKPSKHQPRRHQSVIFVEKKQRQTSMIEFVKPVVQNDGSNERFVGISETPNSVHKNETSKKKNSPKSTV